MPLAIDIDNEHRLTLAQAAKEPILCAAGGTPLHVSTVYRLMSTGLLSSVTGERIRLEFVLTVRGRITSREAIQRFIARLNGLPPVVGAIAVGGAAHVAAEREAAALLDAAGIR